MSMDQKLVQGENENLKCNNPKISIESPIIYNHNVKCTIKMVFHDKCIVWNFT